MHEEYWVRWGTALHDDISSFAVPPGALALWYLGQMGLAVKSLDTVVYIDPFFSEKWTTDAAGNKVSRRKYPPPYAGNDVRHAQVVLGTHNHSDHIDVPTFAGIAAGSPEAVFVVPAPHVQVLVDAGIAAARVKAARAGEVLQVGAVKITPIPSAHEDLARDAHGDFLALGYVLDLGGVRLYHSGDTVEYPELKSTIAAHQVHIAALPINGADQKRRERRIIGNMNFREAADVGYAAGAQLLIPLHYDMFANNSENPAYFVDYLYRTYPRQAFKMMAPGERMVYWP